MERKLELPTKHPVCLIWEVGLPMALARSVVVQNLENANRALQQRAAVVVQELRHQPTSAMLGLRRAAIVLLGILRAANATAGETKISNATLAAISFK